MRKKISRFSLLILILCSLNIFQGKAIAATNTASETNEMLQSEIGLLRSQMKQMQTHLVQLEKKYEQVQASETILAKYTAHNTKMGIILSSKGHHTAGSELIFSGNLSIDTSVADRTTSTTYTGTGSNSMKLSNAQINAHASVTPWARAYVSLNDDFGSSNPSERASDSLEFEQAYLQFGRSQAPLVFNLGKQYLPFGVYKHHPISSSLTQELSEFVKNAAVVGYKHEKFFSSAYIFQGQGSVNGPTKTTSEKLNHNYGFEIGTANKKDPKFGYEASLGYIANLAEARNINFIVPKTHHAVGNLGPHLSLNFGKLNFIFDYTHAINTFNVNDISMNGKPARPRAFSTEMHYHFLTNKHPSTVSFGYQRSWDSLFLNMAKHRYVTSYNYYFNQYVTLQFELMHNIDYGSNEQAAYLTSSNVTEVIQATGKSSNSGTMRLSLHF